jgi:5-oxoprolinase (ATP-hydrolysing)
MGLASQSLIKEQAIEQTLDASVWPQLQATLTHLSLQAQTTLRSQITDGGDLQTHERVHLRYAGSDSPLVVAMGSVAEVKAAFARS